VGPLQPAGLRRSAKNPSAFERLLSLQAAAGNSAVTHLLNRQPAPAPPTTAPLKRFDFPVGFFFGPRFDMSYIPVGPLPAVGKASVTLNVHVKFKDFDRSMMRRKEFMGHKWTKAQLGQFKWPEDKKKEWVGKFSRVVADGWKEKHFFKLDTPGVEKYKALCDVQVQHVDDPAEANTVMIAQWVPPGAPRLRSSVSGSAKTAELDARDTDEPTKNKVTQFSRVRQIGPFPLNSDKVEDVAGPLAAFVADVTRLRQPGGPLAGSKDDVHLGATGRASSRGAKQYNQELASRRASHVMAKAAADLGLDEGITITAGVQHATAEEKFQRVDMGVFKGDQIEVSQITAVHEAGHMLGLGDEYVEEAPSEKRFAPKFEGDKPSHHDDVEATMGTEVADEHLVHNSDSIMSQGSEVKPGHYVYFLRALNTITSEQWTVV
jgi:hypothetical protein